MRLHFETAGDEANPKVVLLHGITGGLVHWDTVAPALAEDHHVFRVDQRGHGRSGRAPGAYRVDDYSADAIEFLESVVGSPAALVGHSLGGLVGADVAGKRPDLLTCAYLEDPPLFLGDKAQFDSTDFAMVFPLMQATMREMQASGASIDQYIDVLGGVPSMRGEGTLLDELGADGVRVMATTWSEFDPEALTAAIDGSLFEGFEPLKPIDVPVRVARAELTPAFLPQNEAPFLEAQPNATVTFVAGAGHSIHDDAFDVFVADLRRFLAEHARR